MNSAPNPSDELFDVVDDADQVIGQATRREVHARRWNHRAVHVLVFNDCGELFLQKRAAAKDSHPLQYDSSASGHLGAGEDYDCCALRELEEELGLRVPLQTLRKLFKIPAGATTGQEFVWVYSLRGGYEPVINTTEIESGGFHGRASIAQQVREHPERFTPGFIKVFDEYRRFG